MAVLDDLDADAHAMAMGMDANLRATIPWDAARAVLARAIWAWFDEHKHERIVKVKAKVVFIPIRATLKVKDLELPITFIFGPHP